MKDNKQINNFEILTPDGWSDFVGVSCVEKESYRQIKFSNGVVLKCSENHKLGATSSDSFIYAKDAKRGTLIESDVGVISVKSNRKVNKKIKLYDALSVEKKSRYYTDGILSSNCAFMEYAEDIWMAAQPTLSTGGQCVVLSTPNGSGNWFHKTWVDADAGKNGFNTIRLKWNLHPERDQTWRDEQTKNLGVRQSAQECDTDFSSSGNTVIKAEDISYYERLTKDPIEKRRAGQEFWIWEYALSNRSYMVVADVARGDGTDFNAFHILDLETLEQVAEYEGKMSTKEYGRFLVAVATEYNSALLVIENANIGWATLQEVIDLGYENLFYTSSELLYVDVDAQMTNKIGAQEKRMVPGFTMSGKSRPLIISKFELSMHQKEAKINSTRLIEQLKTFIWKGSKAEAASGYNDDIVMSYGTALWIRDTALRLRTQSIELNKAMLNGIGSSTANGENGTPPQGFGGVYRTANMPAKDPWNIQIGNRSEDLTWLIR